MNRDDPLTPEERALAALIGRRHDQAPPTALDAAILAAARASVSPTAEATPDAAHAASSPAPRARRPRSRLPAVFGIAASMVLAVGIAWQMRPEPPAVPAQEAQRAAAPAADDSAGAPEPVAAAAEIPAPAPAPAAPAPAVAAQDVAAAPAAARRPAGAAAPEVHAAPAAAEPAPRVAVRSLPTTPVAEPAFAPAPPAPAAAPAAPAAYSAPAPVATELESIADTPVQAEAAAKERASNDEARSQRRAAPAAFKGNAAPAPSSAPGVMLRRSSDAALSANAVHAEVAADARLPRRQWLQKIRERRDNGQRDLARASLERYLQLYPEARLPRDLRPLLDD